MTKNPVGEQPKDIEQKLMEIIRPYIENPNSLILALSKASDDLANSESLKLAREVDSSGQRTIGVITHLDLVDHDTDAINDLMNKTYPLKLGYVGVICRGPKDIEEKKTIKQKMEEEREFFEKHKGLSKMNNTGINFLIKSLNVNFVNHIKKSLPEIRTNIVALLKVNKLIFY